MDPEDLLEAVDQDSTTTRCVDFTRVRRQLIGTLDEDLRYGGRAHDANHQTKIDATRAQEETDATSHRIEAIDVARFHLALAVVVRCEAEESRLLEVRHCIVTGTGADRVVLHGAATATGTIRHLDEITPAHGVHPTLTGMCRHPPCVGTTSRTRDETLIEPAPGREIVREIGHERGGARADHATIVGTGRVLIDVELGAIEADRAVASYDENRTFLAIHAPSSRRRFVYHSRVPDSGKTM